MLVVDDEPQIVETLALLLEERWPVSTALSATEARAVMTDSPIAVVVADDRMPRESGVDLLGWAYVHRPDTVRILLTGYADAEKVIGAINKGHVWHYVHKPWDNQVLVNLVARGMEYRASRMAVKRSEQLYRELFHNALVGIVRLDADGGVLEANRAFADTLGIADLEDLPGLRFEELCVMPGEWTGLAEQLREHRSVTHQELVLRKRSGALVHVLLNASIHPQGPGSLVIEASTLDLTEQRVARRESAELREIVTRIQRHEVVCSLTAGIVHDFNNDLTVILSNVSYALDMPDLDDELVECLRDIESATRDAADLNRQLVTFASEGDGADPAGLDVNRVLERLSLLIGRIAEPKITVTLEPTPGLPLVLASAAPLHHCLINLCLNACEAMPEGGQLTLASRPGLTSAAGDPRVEVLVKDTGVGMTPDVMSRIFEPFYTTKKRSAGRSGSTGLGLTVTRALLAQNGGTIAVESSRGAGACFTLSLPARHRPAAPAPRPSRLLVAASELAVIADSSLSLRKLLGLALERVGYEIARCSTGQEAIDAVRTHPEVALAVLDLVMPVMDGEEAFAAIRALRPDLPVLITTAHLVTEELQARLEKGGASVLRKPFSIDDLYTALSTSLARAGKSPP